MAFLSVRNRHGVSLRNPQDGKQETDYSDSVTITCCGGYLWKDARQKVSSAPWKLVWRENFHESIATHRIRHFQNKNGYVFYLKSAIISNCGAYREHIY